MTTYARATRALHRVASDRVVVRLVGGEAFELQGVAALTWVAADEPATVDAIAGRVGEVQPAAGDEVAAAVADLVTRGLLREVAG